MSTDNIKKIEPFCLILNKKHNVYDICCKIFLKTQIQIYKLEDEYTNFKVINIDSLEDFIEKNKFIPTSKKILEIIKEKH